MLSKLHCGFFGELKGPGVSQQCLHIADIASSQGLGGKPSYHPQCCPETFILLTGKA